MKNYHRFWKGIKRIIGYFMEGLALFSTSFLVICLCPLVFLVLFCVIYQVALLALFPTCLKKKSKGTDDVVLNQNHFPPITIALFNIICQHFYPHICRTKLLKRKQTPPQSRGLISLFSWIFKEPDALLSKCRFLFMSTPQVYRLSPSASYTMLSSQVG